MAYFFSIRCIGKMLGMWMYHNSNLYILRFKIVARQIVHPSKRYIFFFSFLHTVINSSLKYKYNSEWKAVYIDTSGSFKVILAKGLHTKGQHSSWSLTVLFPSTSPALYTHVYPTTMGMLLVNPLPQWTTGFTWVRNQLEIDPPGLKIV